jgi:hypothetical protein
MTVQQILDLLTQGGVVSLLVLIVVGGWRRWYVWSWQYKEVVKDRDFYRTLAFRGTSLAEKATEAAKGTDSDD